MWADQITAAGGLPVDGGLREPVSGYQIDDAIPLSDKPVTVDIDTAPTQDTAEPQTEAPEAPTEDTALAQDTVDSKICYHPMGLQPLRWPGLK